MTKLLIVLAALFINQSTTYNPALYGMKDGTKEVQEPANPWYPPTPAPSPVVPKQPIEPLAPKQPDENPYFYLAIGVIILLGISTVIFRRCILADAARREEALIEEKEPEPDVGNTQTEVSGVVERTEGSSAGGNDCKPTEAQGG